MSSRIELRVSFYAVAIFLLMNLLRTGTTFGDRFKPSFIQEIRGEPATQHPSARKGGTPTQHMQPFEKPAPTGIWFPETALYQKKSSVQLSSSNLKAENDFTSIPVPDPLPPRRVLRDVSPPGMWPPGTDTPPSSESFMEFARRRLLLSVADSRRKSSMELVMTSSSPGRSVHYDTSPPGMSAVSDSSPSEEFGRSRSLPKLSAPGPDFRYLEDTVSLKQGADALKSRKSPLSCTPGLWRVSDSSPSRSEFATRRLLTGANPPDHEVGGMFSTLASRP